MTHTPEEENRLDFVNWFNKTNQSKDMMDWSFEVWNAALSHQAAEIERLKAEMAECREDAERLRWLDKQNKNLEIDKWVVLGNDCTGEDDYKKYWVGADLRKAIDQARKESE